MSVPSDLTSKPQLNGEERVQVKAFPVTVLTYLSDSHSTASTASRPEALQSQATLRYVPHILLEDTADTNDRLTVGHYQRLLYPQTLKTS